MKKNAHDRQIDAIIQHLLKELGQRPNSQAKELITEAVYEATEAAYTNGFEDGRNEPDPDAPKEPKWIVSLTTPAGLHLTLAKHATKAAAEKDAALMRRAMKPEAAKLTVVIPADQADDAKI